KVRVWDARTGAELLVLKGHQGFASCAAFSPDGRRIVSGGTDRIVRSWCVASGAELRTFAGHAGGVDLVAFTPDGARIVSAGVAETVRVWDTRSGAELLRLSRMLVAALSPDGKHLAGIAAGKSASILSADTGKQVVALKGPRADAGYLVYSPD